MKNVLWLATLPGVLLLAQDGPESVLRPSKRFDKRVVVSGLANPWEITLGPDNWLWVTERSGKRVVRINPPTGEKKTAITIDEVAAPGGQDGLLGLALDWPHNHVYVSYTYVDKTLPPDPRVALPNSPYRHLYAKVVRLNYDRATQTLGSPVDIIKGLPAGNDHNAMRLKLGPDRKLYLTIGDQGNNQLGNFCHPVLAQRLPTAAEMKAQDFAAYEGKSLRINLDGSIPQDNPKLAGVVSHVFTYGHRNPQGLDFAPDGTLYAAEHGPKTDDEVDILVKGGNYGWPHVAGFRDNKAYEFARWAEATTPCAELRFSDLAIHPSVPREPETAFTQPMVDPIATMFTVPTGFNFEDPACGGVNYICWPTIGISSIEHYEGGAGRIPGWDRVVMITTLKRGSLYVLPLTKNGQKAAGKFSRYFQSDNRYRDTAVSADGRTIYIATDARGMAQSRRGGVTTRMEEGGAILAFTYAGEGAPAEELFTVSKAAPEETASRPVGRGQSPPQYTAQQAAEGRKAYEAYCAVCHGNTLTNGTMGTPLAGSYFERKWTGQTVHAFLEKSRTMPPSAAGSLPAEVYTNVVAYILEFNGAQAGEMALPAGGEALKRMWIAKPAPEKR